VDDKPELVQQIRYVDGVTGSRDRNAFYLVDLLGLGFAKVPQQQRQHWSNFMGEYLLKDSGDNSADGAVSSSVLPQLVRAKVFVNRIRGRS